MCSNTTIILQQYVWLKTINCLYNSHDVKVIHNCFSVKVIHKRCLMTINISWKTLTKQYKFSETHTRTFLSIEVVRLDTFFPDTLYSLPCTLKVPEIESPESKAAYCQMYYCFLHFFKLYSFIFSLIANFSIFFFAKPKTLSRTFYTL